MQSKFFLNKYRSVIKICLSLESINFFNRNASQFFHYNGDDSFSIIISFLVFNIKHRSTVSTTISFIASAILYLGDCFPFSITLNYSTLLRMIGICFYASFTIHHSLFVQVFNNFVLIFSLCSQKTFETLCYSNRCNVVIENRKIKRKTTKFIRSFSSKKKKK